MNLMSGIYSSKVEEHPHIFRPWARAAPLDSTQHRPGVPFEVYDKEKSPTRKSNWSIGLHGGSEPLREFVPPEMLTEIEEKK